MSSISSLLAQSSPTQNFSQTAVDRTEEDIMHILTEELKLHMPESGQKSMPNAMEAEGNEADTEEVLMEEGAVIPQKQQHELSNLPQLTIPSLNTTSSPINTIAKASSATSSLPSINTSSSSSQSTISIPLQSSSSTSLIPPSQPQPPPSTLLTQHQQTSFSPSQASINQLNDPQSSKHPQSTPDVDSQLDKPEPLKVASFVRKVYDIVNDTTNKKLVSWSSKGPSFVVCKIIGILFHFKHSFE